MEVSEELFFNIVKDWEKKGISTEEKGRFIKAWITENKLSERKASEILGIPYSTLNDWISQRQMVKYYNAKKMREDIDSIKRNEIDCLLDRIIFVMSKDDIIITDKTKYLVKKFLKEIELRSDLF